MRARLPLLLLALAGLGLSAGPARAQESPVRLAAPADCSTNPNCAPGLRRTYGTAPPSSAMVRLTVADAGIQALDDGLAEVAVAFSSDPGLSRPDIRVLRDDRGMIGPDRVVPVVRSSLLRHYGRDLRRRLDAASRLLTTLALRGLNQQVIDGRLPEAVGGEFIDANGLGGTAKRREGPRIVIGYQDFAENETLAHLYATALRAGGYRVTVRAIGGLRQAAVSAMRRGRIDFWPGYDGSLLEYLKGRTLRRALARIGAEPLALSQAQNRNVFATKTDTAARLGLQTISDMVRRWSAGHRPRRDRSAAGRAVGVRRERRAGAARGLENHPGRRRRRRDRGLRHQARSPRPGAERLGQLPRAARQRRRRRRQRLYRRRLRHRSQLDPTFAGSRRRSRAWDPRRRDRGRGRQRARRRRRRPAREDHDRPRPRPHRRGDDWSGRRGHPLRRRQRRAGDQRQHPGRRTRRDWSRAIAAAGAANALVVVSAGNSARDIDTQPSYPAAIAAPNLVSVAATAPTTADRPRQLLQLRPPDGRARRARRATSWRPPTTVATAASPAPRWRPRSSPASPR